MLAWWFDVQERGRWRCTWTSQMRLVPQSLEGKAHRHLGVDLAVWSSPKGLAIGEAQSDDKTGDSQGSRRSSSMRGRMAPQAKASLVRMWPRCKTEVLPCRPQENKKKWLEELLINWSKGEEICSCRVMIRSRLVGVLRTKGLMSYRHAQAPPPCAVAWRKPS
jgi:hypothetical protein